MTVSVAANALEPPREERPPKVSVNRDRRHEQDASIPNSKRGTIDEDTNLRRYARVARADPCAEESTEGRGIVHCSSVNRNHLHGTHAPVRCEAVALGGGRNDSRLEMGMIAPVHQPSAQHQRHRAAWSVGNTVQAALVVGNYSAE